MKLQSAAHDLDAFASDNRPSAVANLLRCEAMQRYVAPYLCSAPPSSTSSALRNRSLARTRPHLATFLQARRDRTHRARLPGRHLHRAIQLSHRHNPVATRHRRQWLVQSRTRRSPILETIQSPRARPKDLGRIARARPEVHLRKTFLVVQHVFHRGLLHHPAPDVSGRWPQSFRYLHLGHFPFATKSRRDLGEFPFPAFWGPAAGVDTPQARRTPFRAGSPNPPNGSKINISPTLSLIYLPHLDYNLQRLGPVADAQQPERRTPGATPPSSRPPRDRCHRWRPDRLFRKPIRSSRFAFRIRHHASRHTRFI